MLPSPRSAAVFGPFDGDFDPFDDDEDSGALVTFGRGPANGGTPRAAGGG